MKKSGFAYPVRIQRKRTKGFRMPEDSMYAGRPTKWGNPFKEFGDMVYVHCPHRRKSLDPWVYFGMVKETGGAWLLFHNCLNKVKKYKLDPEIHARFEWMRENIHLLNKKHIACFCNIHQDCHVDSLIEYHIFGNK